MKKLLIPALLLVILLTFTKAANATTTLFWGRTIGGNETIHDNFNPRILTGELENTVIDLTMIKKYKFNLEYQFGKSEYFMDSSAIQLREVEIGYPIIDQENGLIYLSGGFLNYYRDHLSDAQGFMLGIDVISVVTDRVYVEMDLQYSLFGASYRIDFVDFPGDQISLKLKTQFVLTDHLGLVVNFRYLYFNANNGLILDNVVSSSAGLVYRF